MASLIMEVTNPVSQEQVYRGTDLEAAKAAVEKIIPEIVSHPDWDKADREFGGLMAGITFYSSAQGDGD